MLRSGLSHVDAVLLLRGNAQRRRRNEAMVFVRWLFHPIWRGNTQRWQKCTTLPPTLAR